MESGIMANGLPTDTSRNLFNPSVLWCYVMPTSINIEPETRDRLRAEKIGGESYDDVIKRLLQERGSGGVTHD